MGVVPLFLTITLFFFLISYLFFFRAYQEEQPVFCARRRFLPEVAVSRTPGVLLAKYLSRTDAVPVSQMLSSVRTIDSSRLSFLPHPRFCFPIDFFCFCFCFFHVYTPRATILRWTAKMNQRMQMLFARRFKRQNRREHRPSKSQSSEDPRRIVAPTPTSEGQPPPSAIRHGIIKFRGNAAPAFFEKTQKSE